MNLKKFILSFHILIAVCICEAQVNVSGTVRDAALKPVAGASVYLLNTGRGAVSGLDGRFVIPSVYPGTYTIEFSAVGFASNHQKVVVRTETASVDAVLNPAPYRLENVVVTAQKREEVVQSLPVSITALSARRVEEYRLWNSRDLTAIVPNLYSADPGDKRNVTGIRGIATTSYDPAVATYIDGVNQFNLDTYIPTLFDVERIEVLRWSARHLIWP
jgi:iron complex outermembrane receptor protein